MKSLKPRFLKSRNPDAPGIGEVTHQSRQYRPLELQLAEQPPTPAGQLQTDHSLVQADFPSEAESPAAEAPR